MAETQMVKAVDEVKGALAKMQDQFAAALPKHIPAERFIRVAQTAIANSPSLLTLDRSSLYVSLTQSAQDGLLPDGREAAIIPFAGKAKYMPMVAGICKKARNSGEVSVIDAQVVYEKDDYDAWVDEKGPHFKHKRGYGDRGKIILTYAYAIMKDGGVAFEEIDETQMLSIKEKSRASDSPWKGPFADEMRRKSALRRLAKYRLPSSSDLDVTLSEDNELYDEVEEIKEEKTTSSRLSKVVEAQVVEEKPMTATEAAAVAKEVFKDPRPAQASGNSVTGKIEDIKVQNSKDPNKKWTRYACKVQGKYLGTFDDAIGKGITEAVDSGAEVIVGFKERQEQTKDGLKVYRDITSFSVVTLAEREEGEELEAEEIPI